MNLHITKSKNAESFYIAKSYTKANGKTSSVIVRKLGTLNQLIVEHGPTRDDVLAWAKNEVKIETEKYKKDPDLILEPFETSKRDANSNLIGTGMGMWIVNKTVKEYYGDIDLSQNKERQSGFVVNINLRGVFK